MKRRALSLLTCALLLTAVAAIGCGDEPTPDPGEVINRAFSEPAGNQAATGVGAEVEVASLGYQDHPLEIRRLAVDPKTYTSIREAIGGPASTPDDADGGLRSLITDLESEGREQIGGVEVDRVSGSLDVDQLIGKLRAATEAGAAPGTGGTELPGLGSLAQLEKMLTEASFDLYAKADNGGLERFELTLSVDDRENASPPTRFRFSLTESDPKKASS